MKKWIIKTNALRGFEVGDVVESVLHVDEKKQVIVRYREDLPRKHLLGLSGTFKYLDADLIDQMPEWFEEVKIKSIEQIPLYMAADNENCITIYRESPLRGGTSWQSPDDRFLNIHVRHSYKINRLMELKLSCVDEIE